MMHTRRHVILHAASEDACASVEETCVGVASVPSYNLLTFKPVVLFGVFCVCKHA